MECINTFRPAIVRWRVIMFFYAVHMLKALFGFEEIRLTKTKLLQKMFTSSKLQVRVTANYYLTSFKNEYKFVCRSLWLFGLKGGSKDTWILRLRVRIPLREWLLLTFVCCVQPLGRDWSLVQRSPTKCVLLILCDLETSATRRTRPELDCW